MEPTVQLFPNFPLARLDPFILEELKDTSRIVVGLS